MKMILGKCKLENSVSLFSVTYVVGTHWYCLIDAITMCIYAYVLVIKEFFTILIIALTVPT